LVAQERAAQEGFIPALQLAWGRLEGKFLGWDNLCFNSSRWRRKKTFDHSDYLREKGYFLTYLRRDIFFERLLKNFLCGCINLLLWPNLMKGFWLLPLLITFEILIEIIFKSIFSLKIYFILFLILIYQNNLKI
jgi:hypothetical protein